MTTGMDPNMFAQFFGDGTAMNPVVPAAPVVTAVTPVIPGMDPNVPAQVMGPQTTWDKIKAMGSAFGNSVSNGLDPAKMDPKNLRIAALLGTLGGAVGGNTPQGNLGNAVAGMARSNLMSGAMAPAAAGVAPAARTVGTSDALGVGSSAMTRKGVLGDTSKRLQQNENGTWEMISSTTIPSTPTELGGNFNEPVRPTEGTRAPVDYAGIMSALTPEMQETILKSVQGVERQNQDFTTDNINNAINIKNALKGPNVAQVVTGNDGKYYKVMMDGGIVGTGINAPDEFMTVQAPSGEGVATQVINKRTGKPIMKFYGQSAKDLTAYARLRMDRGVAMSKLEMEALEKANKMVEDGRYEYINTPDGKQQRRRKLINPNIVESANRLLKASGSTARYNSLTIKAPKDTAWFGKPNIKFTGEPLTLTFVTSEGMPSTEAAIQAFMDETGAERPDAVRYLQEVYKSDKAARESQRKK